MRVSAIFVTGHSYTFSFSREYFTMIQKVSSFLKKDTVLTIALALAVLSMFIIPPSAGYLGYLDLHTLILLFGLMTATTGLQNIGFFRQLGELLLLRIHSLRQLEQLLILLCFFSSMLITNDVALITFVPFALELLRMVNRKDRIVPVVVCQTLAANLGSMTTPVGNPQNLYLYSHFELSLDTSVHFRCFHWFCFCSSQCLHQGRLSHSILPVEIQPPIRPFLNAAFSAVWECFSCAFAP